MIAVPARLPIVRASRPERATTTRDTLRPPTATGCASATGAGAGRNVSSMAAMYSTGVARPR